MDNGFIKNVKTLPHQPDGLRPEEIIEPAQEPPEEIITEKDKEEAAKWEALNLSPRHALPLEKRVEAPYPAKHPSPHLESAFFRYHKNILKIFRAGAGQAAGGRAKGFFAGLINALTSRLRTADLKRREKTENCRETILAYAREKNKVTHAAAAALIGAKERAATELLDGLVKSGDLVRSGEGKDAVYKPVRY